MDHDQRFKTLIQTFFAEFLALFFAMWAERLDASAAEWLDKEVFPDPPEGDRRILDLVAKVPTRLVVPKQHAREPDHWLALVHLEIESPDKATPLRHRMFRSYVYLRDKYQLPVLPIGVDTYEEHFWELRAIRFEYLYVGLPGLDGVQYVQGDNWLGVALAALMKIPHEQIAWLGAEALRRIQEAPLTDQKRFLLGECVQAYLPLDEDQQREFESLIAGEPYKGVQAVNKTVFEKGMEQGTRKSLKLVLEERFGPLSPPASQRLDQWPSDQVESLFKSALKAQNLKELGLED